MYSFAKRQQVVTAFKYAWAKCSAFALPDLVGSGTLNLKPVKGMAQRSIDPFSRCLVGSLVPSVILIHY